MTTAQLTAQSEKDQKRFDKIEASIAEIKSEQEKESELNAGFRKDVTKAVQDCVKQMDKFSKNSDNAALEKRLGRIEEKIWGDVQNDG